MAKTESTPIRIISIIGPTATGKTKLALKMAEAIIEKGEYTGVDIISADSRQIYKAFEVLSGADLGDFRVMGFEWLKKPFFTYPYLAKMDEKMRLHGAAIVDLKSEWSLAHFHHLATQIINQSITDNRAVIIVGGTMLYHDRLFEDNQHILIPPNEEFRQKASKMTIPELQNELKKVDPEKFKNLNNSDVNNPRRLIRYLEINLALTNQDNMEKVCEELNSPAKNKFDHQYYMPDFNQDELKSKIAQRVHWRFKAGAVEEVKKALQIISAEEEEKLALPLGYKEIKAFLTENLPESECINLWTLNEWRYAKRQITWWKSREII